MKRKPIVITAGAVSLNDVFPRFVSAKIAEGVSDKTAKMYQQHFHSISKHLDVSTPLDELTQDDINSFVVSMRKSGLAHNSISSYARVLRTMLKWCREQGYTNAYVPPIKDRETVKETYSDSELSALLRKPDKNCDFTEYRNWGLELEDVVCQTEQRPFHHCKLYDISSEKQILMIVLIRCIIKKYGESDYCLIAARAKRTSVFVFGVLK